MTASPHGRLFAARVATLVLVLSALPPILISQTNEKGQPSGERFWLAGRYDANRVIIYFDTVAFSDTLSSNSRQITPPVAKGFFGPVGIDQTFARRFQGAPGTERFSLGDRYDLLLGGDLVRTVTLTDLVGAETDEGVGNDSFLGALGSLNKDDLLLENDYYVVRRHHESPNANASEKGPPMAGSTYAYLEPGPVRFDVQMQIADLLTGRMKVLATEAARRATERVSPLVEVKAFHLSDGKLRYYASAGWYSGTRDTDDNSYAIGAWLSSEPTLHIIALEPRTFGYQGEEPKLLNVLDLGGGRTGVIVFISTEASIETDLLEYRDGVILKDMRVLQSISTGD
ncbi:MAG: hypothetical protein ACLPHP_14595 [Candidatus Sulfotelmatobacter sp.]